jgi:hypothetical protein
MENVMLICEATAPAATTAHAGKITLGGGYRLPVKAETSNVTLGGGYRLPVKAESSKVTLGGGYRLPVRRA